MWAWDASGKRCRKSGFPSSPLSARIRRHETQNAPLVCRNRVGVNGSRCLRRWGRRQMLLPLRMAGLESAQPLGAWCVVRDFYVSVNSPNFAKQRRDRDRKGVCCLVGVGLARARQNARHCRTFPALMVREPEPRLSCITIRCEHFWHSAAAAAAGAVLQRSHAHWLTA